MASGQVNYNDEVNDKDVEDYRRTLRQHHYNKNAVLLLGGPPPPDDPSFEKAVKLYKEERQREAEQKAVQARQNNSEYETEWWRCLGDECKVDHSIPLAAVTINRELGEAVLVEVAEDGGSSADFISPNLVQRLNLRTQPVEIATTLAFQTMTDTFLATRKVELTLIGRSKKSLHREYLVAPNTCPFSGILAGRPFIKECGVPHTLFLERNGSECNIIRQKTMTEAERVSKERARAENERKAAELEALKKQRAQSRNSAQRTEAEGGQKEAL